MSNHFTPLRAAIHAILSAPANYNWTVQGLGMLRCYPFGGTLWRLNVWNDHCRRVPPASDMHDHPWHLVSWIMSGELYNQRYVVVERDMPGEEFEYREILCGPDAVQSATEATPLRRMKLGKCPLETYGVGKVYSQRAEEIHSTTFQNGTVTLNLRERVNGDNAKIFYPVGTEWVDAAPREATPFEIATCCDVALNMWRKL